MRLGYWYWYWYWYWGSRVSGLVFYSFYFSYFFPIISIAWSEYFNPTQDEMKLFSKIMIVKLYFLIFLHHVKVGKFSTQI